MATPITPPKNEFIKKIPVGISVASLVLGPILSIGFGYVSGKQTAAAEMATQTQRISTLELINTDQQKQLDYFHEHYPTRDEINPQLLLITHTLDRIENNINNLNNR